jgi:hypothetical protein
VKRLKIYPSNFLSLKRRIFEALDELNEERYIDGSKYPKNRERFFVTL